MAPEVKQRFQQMAEEGRQKYDQEMAAYRQGNYVNPNNPANATSTTPAATATSGTVNVTQGGTTTSYIAGTDYSSLLQ
jgi:hypothetical protein